ncbi:MAG TPA: hypothetical protein VFT74_07840, partial [Isosphaeraceae bacterium]|nr:hypothetical protein [Isosphaeraceae bacterium]
MPEQAEAHIPVLFFSESSAAFPTIDRRHLRIAENAESRGLLAIRNETGVAERAGENEEAFVDLPTDVLSAELRIADAQGRLWQTTSFFSAELLVARMI